LFTGNLTIIALQLKAVLNAMKFKKHTTTARFLLDVKTKCFWHVLYFEEIPITVMKKLEESSSGYA